jgi:hypothetical protein
MDLKERAIVPSPSVLQIGALPNERGAWAWCMEERKKAERQGQPGVPFWKLEPRTSTSTPVQRLPEATSSSRQPFSSIVRIALVATATVPLFDKLHRKSGRLCLDSLHSCFLFPQLTF